MLSARTHIITPFDIRKMTAMDNVPTSINLEKQEDECCGKSEEQVVSSRPVQKHKIIMPGKSGGTKRKRQKMSKSIQKSDFNLETDEKELEQQSDAEEARITDIDRMLEEQAAKRNLSVVNVKSILHVSDISQS